MSLTGSKSQKYKTFVPPLLLILICFIPFFVNILTNTTPANAGGDTVRAWYPSQTFKEMAYGSGHFPLWSPHMFCGFSMIGYPYIMPLYPINGFMLSHAKYTVAVMPHLFIHLVICAMGIFLLLRALGINSWVSCFVALNFVFCFEILNKLSPLHALPTLQSIAWIPFIILCAIRFIECGSFIQLLGVIGLSPLIIFGGGIEEFAYFVIWGMLGAVCMCLTLRLPKTAYWRLFVLGMILGLVFLIGEVILLPTSEFTSQSLRREGITYSLYSSGFKQLVKVPSYLQNPLLITIVCGMAFSIIKRKTVLTALFLCSLAGFLFIGPSSLVKTMYTIPVLNFFRSPIRIIIVIGLWACFLGAKGLNFISEKNFLPLARSGVFKFAVFTILTILVIHGWQKKPRNLLDYDSNYAHFFNNRGNLDRSINFLKNPIHVFDYKRTTPQPLPRHSGFFFNTQTIEGCVRVSPYYIARILSTLGDNLLVFRDKKLEFSAVHLNLLSWGIIKKANFRILNLINLRYIVSEHVRETFKGPPLRQIYRDERFVIYENTEACPRCMIIHNTTVEPDTDKAIDLLVNAPNFNTRSVLVASEPPPVPEAGIIMENQLFEEARIERYEFDRVAIFAYLEKPAWLLLTDSYYPGWVASSNGKPQKIHRVNVAFRGLFLGAGGHQIVFTYLPIPFHIGLWGSLTSILTWLIILATHLFIRGSSKSSSNTNNKKSL